MGWFYKRKRRQGEQQENLQRNKLLLGLEFLTLLHGPSRLRVILSLCTGPSAPQRVGHGSATDDSGIFPITGKGLNACVDSKGDSDSISGDYPFLFSDMDSS